MKEGGRVSLERRRLKQDMRAVCKHLKDGRLKTQLDGSVFPRARRQVAKGTIEAGCQQRLPNKESSVWPWANSLIQMAPTVSSVK